VQGLFCLGYCSAMMAVPITMGIHMKFDDSSWLDPLRLRVEQPGLNGRAGVEHLGR